MRFTLFSKKLTVAIILFLGVQPLFAQNKVTGNVSNQVMHVPFVGATVLLKNTTTAVITDESGNFTISSSKAFPWILVISHTGYKTQDVSVKEMTSNLSVQLIQSTVSFDEVVVSASRRPEKIQESPSAISVISSKKLQVDNVGNPIFSLRNMTGVDIAQTGVGDGQINLRGRGAAFNTETYILADYRSVLLPSFGTIQFGQQPIDPIDLDRIEVVKGPGGALYGPGVEAGVVHFLSKSPFKEKGTSFSIGGGNQSQFQFAFRQAGVSKSGKLGYKLTGFYRSAMEFQADTINDPIQRARIALYPTSILSSIDSTVVAPGVLDYHNKALSVSGTLEYRFNKRTSLTGLVGFGQASALFKSGQGDGFTKAVRPFAQIRLQSGHFFAQTFWSQQAGKDGQSWLYVSGFTAINIINQFEGQAQYEFNPDKRKKLDIIVGSDYRFNSIDTKGTVDGRFENSDKYLIYGAYAQAKYAITPKLNFLLAGRVDRFDALKATAVSPRLGFVYKADNNNSFRITYNHAVGAPTALQLYNDLAAANKGAFYAWINAGSQPLTFTQNRYYNFVTKTTGTTADLSNKVTYGAVTAGLPAALKAYMNRQTANVTGVTAGTLLTQPITRDAIGLSTSDVFEFGYAGKINNKWGITVDLYTTRRDNNLTPAYQGGSLIGYANAGTDLQTQVTTVANNDSVLLYSGGALNTTTLAAKYKTGIEGTTLKAGVMNPLGLLSADQSPTGKTLDLTYFNLEAITYWGSDIGVNYTVNNNLSVFANYSHLSQVYWAAAQVKNSSSTVAFALNQPADRIRVGFDYIRDKGFFGNASLRYSSAWTGVNGSAWSGDITSFNIVDAGMGYAFNSKMRINFTCTNLFNADYRALANSPFIKRLVLLKATFGF